MSMEELTLDTLDVLLKDAKDFDAKYIGVVIEMEGFEKPEIIINRCENFDKKMKYYEKAYNYDLTHKQARGIKIIDFDYGSTFEELEWRLEYGKND